MSITIQHVLMSCVYYYFINRFIVKIMLPRVNITDRELTFILILMLLIMQFCYIVIIQCVELYDRVNYYGLPGLF